MVVIESCVFIVIMWDEGLLKFRKVVLQLQQRLYFVAVSRQLKPNKIVGVEVNYKFSKEIQPTRY